MIALSEGKSAMTDGNRSGDDAHDPVPVWELIPDLHTPDVAIIMRFPDPNAARALLLAVGFRPTRMIERVPATHDQRSAAAFIHPDGSRVVLARRRFVIV